MNALVDLALAISEKEKTPETASALVKSALEQHRVEKEAAASQDIVALLRQIEQHKLKARGDIRKAKVALKKLVAGLDDLDRRWEYAQATNNFLPVLAYFGKVTTHDLADPSDFERLTNVPGDWKAAD